jgi:alpha-D-ribose 1-methylphosphonate 5-triphosphate synthase subunit PhnG
VKDLARVHSIDEGNVGIEARLIAAKALMKLERPADAAALLEPATKSDEGKGRAQLGTALAQFAAGDETKARAALVVALDANANYGKALLGRVRRRVENVAGARPGSLEEALLYTQTYGDVWTDAAKKFLEKVLDERAEGKTQEKAQEKAAAPADEDEAAAPAELTPAAPSGATSSGTLAVLTVAVRRRPPDRYFLADFSSASQSSIFLLRLSSSAVCSSSGFLSPAKESSRASG